MRNKKLVVGITQGDSNGIGYEVIIKALADPRILEMLTPVVYGSSKIFGFYKKSVHNIDQMDTNVINSAKDAHPKRINILNCLPDNAFAEPGGATADSAQAAITSLEIAVKDLKDGLIDVLVTGPINKKAIVNAGFGFPGHTEYLQQAFGVKDVTMFMISQSLKVGVVTGHIPLKDVPGSLSIEKVVSKLHLLKNSLEKDFGIDNPSIGVLSLNPHSGDSGLLGTEEEEIIIPAIKQANEENIQAYGPFSPDGYFGMGHYARFDATLAMYHDQGLAPFKAISYEDGVNYTAGLPVVRTAPDHGTAFELAGRDEADSRSMRAAIYTALDIYQRRKDWEALQKGKITEDRQEDEEERNGDRPGKPQIA